MSPAAMHAVVLGGAFVILWFLSFQIVLPIGIRTAHESGEEVATGHDPGAPVRPRIVLKLGIATAAAVVLWLIFYALILFGVLDL